MSEKDKQPSTEDLFQKKIGNKIRTLTNRLDKIKSSEIKLKKDGKSSLTLEQLNNIENKKTLILILEENQKISAYFSEIYKSNKKNVDNFENNRDKNNGKNTEKNDDKKLIENNNTLSDQKLKIDDSKLKSQTPKQNDQNKITEELKMCVKNQNTIKNNQNDSTLSNFFFKLLASSKVFIRNDSTLYYEAFSKENIEQFDFDLLREVFNHLISNGKDDYSLSAQGRISDQENKHQKEGFNNMLICNYKLAKISYELDKMIKSGFIEWILIPSSSHLSNISTPESSKKRVDLLLESSNDMLKSAKCQEKVNIDELTKKLDKLGVDDYIDTNQGNNKTKHQNNTKSKNQSPKYKNQNQTNFEPEIQYENYDNFEQYDNKRGQMDKKDKKTKDEDGFEIVSQKRDKTDNYKQKYDNRDYYNKRGRGKAQYNNQNKNNENYENQNEYNRNDRNRKQYGDYNYKTSNNEKDKKN